VRALKALWTEEEPEFHGRHVDFGPVRFEPKPVQKPHPPIVFGGESEAALRRAADLGDGWYGVGHTPETAAVQVGTLRALRTASGGAPLEITVSHAGGTLTGEAVQHYAEAGVDRVVVLPWNRGREAEDGLARLRDALGP
jgi:alkanesulfonate monooxygenase SsuD/methylene tetrahydromethanopterin reductase-like flavin-dependent oxidoreductase (luciferase family)